CSRRSRRARATSRRRAASSASTATRSVTGSRSTASTRAPKRRTRTERGVEERFFDDLKKYVAFGEQDARALSALRPLLSRKAHAVIETFYARILEHPRASKAITGGAEQVERLKGTLRRWLVELADGDYGKDYL